MKAPVLLIVFNRKETALKTLAEIAKYQPAKLYVAGDGARTHKAGELALVSETRKAVLDAITWECEVQTLFQKQNLGCGQGVYSAINWFLTTEESGIILEDDCVPLPGFFNFCSELLEKYKDDDRVGGITGYNPLKKQVLSDSYGFSKYVENWGWATWQRAWKHMDLDMNWLKDHQKIDIISNAGHHAKDFGHWEHNLKLIEKNKVSAWDIQWSFSVAAQNQLTIYPKYNLITNIGQGEQATHTGEHSPLLNFKTDKDLEFPLKHPKYVVPNIKLDEAILKQRNHFLAKLARFFPESIKSSAKKTIGKLMG